MGFKNICQAFESIWFRFFPLHEERLPYVTCRAQGIGKPAQKAVKVTREAVKRRSRSSGGSASKCLARSAARSLMICLDDFFPSIQAS
jgi:hypothetical protein